MSKIPDETTTNRLKTLIQSVESRLARYYGFEPSTSAADHLMPQSELNQHVQDRDNTDMGNQQQGSVAITQCEVSSDVFLGIAFAPKILDDISLRDPAIELSTKNINAACVIIEEVSHFHLLVNRAQKNQHVSQLELEWQGEIDKLLVCAQFLQDQCGDAHMLPLARQIYDLSEIYCRNPDLTNRYWEATRLAAQFWFGALTTAANDSAPLRDPNLQKRLTRAYAASWAGKLEAVVPAAYREVS